MALAAEAVNIICMEEVLSPVKQKQKTKLYFCKEKTTLTPLVSLQWQVRYGLMAFKSQWPEELNPSLLEEYIIILSLRQAIKFDKLD